MKRNNQPLPSFDANAAFVQVARSQGFTPAARASGRSVSMLSRLVRDLEAHLGAQLLMRTTRRVRLTEAGELYLAHAEALLHAQRAAMDAVTELTGGVPRGRLRVSMPVAVGERLLAPRLPELRRRYPELELEIDLSDRNVPLLQGGYDLVLRVGRLQDSSLRAQLLGRVQRRLVASPSYLARRRPPKRPSDLSRHDLLVTGPIAGPVEWTFYQRPSGEPVRVPAMGGVQMTSPALAVQLAVSGLGLLRTTEWVMRDELQRGTLVEVMTDYTCDAPTEGGLPVWVVYAQGPDATPPLKARVFVELVQAAMQTEVLGKRRRVRTSD